MGKACIFRKEMHIIQFRLDLGDINNNSHWRILTMIEMLISDAVACSLQKLPLWSMISNYVSCGILSLAFVQNERLIVARGTVQTWITKSILRMEKENWGRHHRRSSMPRLECCDKYSLDRKKQEGIQCRSGLEMRRNLTLHFTLVGSSYCVSLCLVFILSLLRI